MSFLKSVIISWTTPSVARNTSLCIENGQMMIYEHLAVGNMGPPSLFEMVRRVKESGSLVNAYIVEGVSRTVMTIHEHSLAHLRILPVFSARWRWFTTACPQEANFS